MKAERFPLPGSDTLVLGYGPDGVTVSIFQGDFGVFQKLKTWEELRQAEIDSKLSPLHPVMHQKRPERTMPAPETTTTQLQGDADDCA